MSSSATHPSGTSIGSHAAIALACAMASTAAAAGPISSTGPYVTIDRNITILSFATTANASTSSSPGGGSASFGPCRVEGTPESMTVGSGWSLDLHAPGDGASGSTSCAVDVRFRFSSSTGASTFRGQYNVDTIVDFLPEEEGVVGWSIGLRGTGDQGSEFSFGETRSITCSRWTSSSDCHNFYDFNPYSILAREGEVFTGTLFVNLSADVRFLAEPSSMLLAALALAALLRARSSQRR